MHSLFNVKLENDVIKTMFPADISRFVSITGYQFRRDVAN